MTDRYKRFATQVPWLLALKPRAGYHHAMSRSLEWGPSKDQLYVVGGAVAAGILQRQDVSAKVPKLLPGLSLPANVGILAWAAARYFNKPVLDHVATGLLSVAAYGAGSGLAIAGDETAGDEQISGVVYDEPAPLALGGDDAEGDDYTDGEDE